MDKTERTMAPLNEFGEALIHAAYTCLQGVKPILSATGKGSIKVEVMVWFEFVFFFIHMTNRAAHTQLTSQQFEQLHGFIGELIIPVAIDTYMADWPEEIKAGMRKRFVSDLNNAEIEYASSKELVSKDKPLTGNSLLSKLAKNVASHCESSTNPEVLMSVISLAADALLEANLARLVSNIATVL